MAAGDIWQCQSVVKIGGVNGVVVQHFEVQSGDDGKSQQQIAQDLANDFDSIATFWSGLASSTATFAGVIIQRIHPTRGIQLGFSIDQSGLLAEAAMPAGTSVAMVKRPITKGRSGVGHMSWPGVTKESTARGRLIDAVLPTWIAFGNQFSGSSFDPDGAGTIWAAGVWSRSTTTFHVTNRVDVKAILSRISNRSPKQAI